MNTLQPPFLQVPQKVQPALLVLLASPVSLQPDSVKTDIGLLSLVGRKVLERSSVLERVLNPLLAIPATGYHLLDPSGQQEGIFDKRWNLHVNIERDNISLSPFESAFGRLPCHRGSLNMLWKRTMP